MRYTTIIDITEYPAIWANINARCIYLYMTLRSGYHDDDRDLISASIRRLSRELHLTEGAVRHALVLLERYQLIRRQGNLWQVTKFVIERSITPRAKTKRQAADQEAAAIRQQEHDRLEAERQRQEQQRKMYAAQGKTSFMIWYESEMTKAAAGDPSAIANVNADNHRMYEEHKRAIEQQLSK